MFFIISKTIGLLISPLIFFFILFIIIFIVRIKGNKKNFIFLIPVVLLYLTTLAPVSNLLLRILVLKQAPVPTQKNYYDAVVILSGMVNLSQTNNNYIEFHGDVDRILAGIDIMKDGRARKMILTGGTWNLIDKEKRESRYLERFVTGAGIDKKNIIIEPNSRNTYENALETTKLIKDLKMEKILLITSSYHMRRSLACFKKQGITPDYLMVDFKYIHYYPHSAVIPDERCLFNSYRAMREFFGLISYKIRGYI